ncbi:phage protein [Maridesulfovibrio zosterae]|uniref:phage protein n=1 Tax=Maridesulfovibrio zosterae TaxID=82171 RepID=UPI00041D255E|nr:phage protein [Maridesulfovibrio zosterae]
MAQRLSGKNFDITLGDIQLHVEKASLSIEDNSSAAKDRGVPNGWVDGDVAASGDIEIDATNLKLISEAARAAGSYRELPDYDMLFFAKTGNEEKKVEAFGCHFKIESLLDIDPKGGEKDISKLQFEVTSPDFVRINGVPYLSEADTEGL